MATLNTTRFGIAVDYRGRSSLDTKLGSKTYNYLNFPSGATAQANTVQNFLITTRSIFVDSEGAMFFRQYNPRLVRENQVII